MILLLFISCFQVAPESVADFPWIDADGDGVDAYTEGDCDDSDPNVYPGAPERCDGVDNDCDDATPELLQTVWAPDADGDGFGDGSASINACFGPAGYTAVLGDCDDSNPAINPLAQEVCDDADADEDCDGTVEDADDTVDPATRETWYPDADQDGHGEAGHDGVRACQPTISAALSDDDCDDTEPLANPDEPEACLDRIDNDCDGVVDSCFGSLAYATAAVRGSAGDTLGGAIMAPGDVTGDGQTDLVVGAYAESSNAFHNGAVRVYEGPLDREADASGALLTFTSTTSEVHFGEALASPGDLNADGIAELWVGAPGHGGDSSPTDACLLESPHEDGSTLEESCVLRLTGAAGWHLGSAVTAVLDQDGDSVPELVVGAYGGQTVYLVSGTETGSPAVSDNDLLAGIHSGHDSHLGDEALGIADWDGDDVGDLAVAGTRVSGSGLGEACVLLGPITGTLNTGSGQDCALLTTGAAANDYHGTAIGAGDVDGDGKTDLLVGAHGVDDSAGQVTIYLGGTTGELTSAGAWATLRGGASGDEAGRSVGSGPDLDRDGDRHDVVVGAPNAAGGDGRVYLLTGLTAGAHSLTDANLILHAEDTDDAAGSFVQLVSDLDGGGLPDLLIGAQGWSDGQGAAYVVVLEDL